VRKVKPDYILLGVVIIIIGYFMYSLSFPWVEWRRDFIPTPELVTIHPLRPFSFLLIFAGAIMLGYGFTRSLALGIALGMLVFTLMFILLVWQ
jgi:hypothetical protein